MTKLKVKLYFAKGEDIIEFNITTTKEQINDDASVVMQVAREKGYQYLKGTLEECGEPSLTKTNSKKWLLCKKCRTIWNGSGYEEGEVCPRCGEGVIEAVSDEELKNL